MTDGQKHEPKPATVHTARANREVERSVALDDADFDRASRGLLATHPTGVIDHRYGVAWDLNRYAFVRDGRPSPESVNPSLWRQAQLNANHGLFEVADGIWQVRGYDISNVTFIRGDTGWVVIDPLTTEVTAAAALELANHSLGRRDVRAVIYTHSHADHFGGVHGVTSLDAVAAGEVRIIAPVGFMREAVSENVIAGPAMARRSTYQFGMNLPPGPRGHVDAGLGQAIPTAPPGLIAPTEDIVETGQELTVDGIRIVFQNTPGTEAPAEMNFAFPDHGWLCMAENCTHTMHNLVPIRGAQVRDSLSWSKYIQEALELFGDRAEILFASHHWPRWGSDDVRRFLCLQRDLYRWMHDQTVRRANRGWTALEIAEDLRMPEEFLDQGHTRGYYGSLAHNVKAVYQRYLSWYDGNPARLAPHPPSEAGRRYVELAGGAAPLLDKARAAYAQGDYRWVVELVNHLVFAEPEHAEARDLQADALEQLGYQSESATFRNAYLTGAMELRSGPPPQRDIRRRQLVDALSVDQLFDSIAIRLQAENVGGRSTTTNWTFSDLDSAGDEPAQWMLGLENRALHYSAGRHVADANASITLTKPVLVSLVAGSGTIAEVVADGRMVIEGDTNAVQVVFANLEVFQSGFPIVEP